MVERNSNFLPMSTLSLEFIGWEKPAIELVAKRLLKLGKEHPDTFRKALVVVPTAESGRALREHIAACSEGEDGKRKPTLMPRLCLIGQLLNEHAADIATERETMAAWLQVLLQVAESLPCGEFSTLFPHAPLGDRETWALAMSKRLRQVRSHLEQEELTAVYAERLRHVTLPDGSSDKALQSYLHRMGERWDELQALFARVDRAIHAQQKRTREEARAALIKYPKHRGTLILACEPEVTPQIRTYLNALARKKDADVRIWVNAPKKEQAHFDAFGQPLTDYWTQCPIEIPRALVTEQKTKEDGNKCTVLRDDLSTVHQFADNGALAEAAVHLAGGHDSDTVCIAACDAETAPALHTAFRYAEGKNWLLNLPSGRSFLMTPVGQLPTQLLTAFQAYSCQPDFDPDTFCAKENTSSVMQKVEPLLRNATLQQLFCRQGKKRVSLWGFDAHLDKVMAHYLPASMNRLLQVIGLDPEDDDGKRKQTDEAAERRAAARLVYADYANYVAQCLEKCRRPDSLAALWENWAELLPGTYPADPLKKPVEMLSKELSEMAVFAAEAPQGVNSPLLLLLLQHETEQSSAGMLAEVERAETCGDILGWRELTYSPARRMLLCGMHHGCVPENPQGDAVLPDALRINFGITSSASREARDAFLLTALLKSHDVHFLLARNKEDGTPIIPSSLLLRCSENAELARRANVLFADDKEISEPAKQEHWSLLHALATDGTQPESLALFGKMQDNPYALKIGGENKTFSPSRLNDFLQCPLRFWLKTIWNLAPGDSYREDSTEIPPDTYGTLMHRVLEDFVKLYPNAEAAAGKDENTLCESAAALVRKHVEKVYGKRLSLPLQGQTELLQENMKLFAKQHLLDIKAGWESVAFEQELTPSLEMPGAPAEFFMKADRIDRRLSEDQTWQYRIIDYKSNSANPNSKLAARLKEGEQSLYYRLLPNWTFDNGTALYRWKNVQLPLYALGLRKWVEETYGTPIPQDVVPEMAYFNIPSGKVEVKYNRLYATEFLGSKKRKRDLFTADDLEKALVCVRDVITKIRAGECLYSAESLGEPTLSYADFGALCTNGDPRTLCGLPALF